MPVFLLTDDALHVQPLHPSYDAVVRLFEGLGFGFYDDPKAASVSLDAKKAGRMLGLFEKNPDAYKSRAVRPATHAEILGLTKYRFPLEGLRKIVVGERFPELSVEILGPGIRRETYDLTPDLPAWVAGPATAEIRAYGKAVGALLDIAHQRDWPGERTAGWLDLPAVEWEPTEFPAQEERELPTYRSAPQQQQRILAERGPGELFERLARHLLPRARCSPSRVAMTAEDIFAEFVGQGVHRLPRGLPRWSDGTNVVLGRHAGMRLEVRPEPCPVVELLIDDG